MRRFLALACVCALLAGCADSLPLKDDFGTSALAPVGQVPPEYREFNNYHPQANAIMSRQLCVTKRLVETKKTHPAEPGALINWRGRCAPYRISLFTPAR